MAASYEMHLGNADREAVALAEEAVHDAAGGFLTRSQIEERECLGAAQENFEPFLASLGSSHSAGSGTGLEAPLSHPFPHPCLQRRDWLAIAPPPGLSFLAARLE